jgi:hypothetical protein
MRRGEGVKLSPAGRIPCAGPLSRIAAPAASLRRIIKKGLFAVVPEQEDRTAQDECPGYGYRIRPGPGWQGGRCRWCACRGGCINREQLQGNIHGIDQVPADRDLRGTGFVPVRGNTDRVHLVRRYIGKKRSAGSQPGKSRQHSSCSPRYRFRRCCLPGQRRPGPCRFPGRRE